MIKLKDIKLFEGIDMECISMLIDNSRRVDFIKGDTVISQGAKSDETAYIIQDGKVKVLIDGTEVAEIVEGGIFGEIALITNETRVASIIADTDLVLLKIDKSLLHTIIKKFKNGKDIQEVLMKRILQNAQKAKNS